MKSFLSLFVICMAVSTYTATAADTVCDNFKESGDLIVAYEKIGKKQTYPNIDLAAFYKKTNNERSEFINTTCEVGMGFYEIASQTRSMCFNSCYKESFKISSERPKSWGFIKACGEVCDRGHASLKASAKNNDIIHNKKINVIDSKREAKEMKEIEDLFYQAPVKKTQSK